MKILFVTIGKGTPAARFRCTQFFSFFESKGIRCIHAYGYGDEYNSKIQSKYFALYQLFARIKRGLVAFIYSFKVDLVYLQRPSIPFFPFFEILLKLTGKKIIFDFDDAIYLNGAGKESFLHRFTFDYCSKIAAMNVAGNSFLYNQLRSSVKSKSIIIPTVIDADSYKPKLKDSISKDFIIGWMGTSSHRDNLLSIRDQLFRVLDEITHAKMVIVSNRIFDELKHPKVTQIQWRKENELSDLNGFDVGLMPLLRSPWNEGKCGFKLIQYLAVGKPVLATDLGANEDIVKENFNGFLCKENEDWYNYLIKLINDRSLAVQLGENGRQYVEESFSISSVENKYIKLFNQVYSK